MTSYPCLSPQLLPIIYKALLLQQPRYIACSAVYGAVARAAVSVFERISQSFLLSPAESHISVLLQLSVQAFVLPAAWDLSVQVVLTLL